jgi:hypothetical protein
MDVNCKTIFVEIGLVVRNVFDGKRNCGRNSFEDFGKVFDEGEDFGTAWNLGFEKVVYAFCVAFTVWGIVESDPSIWVDDERV